MKNVSLNKLGKGHLYIVEEVKQAGSVALFDLSWEHECKVTQILLPLVRVHVHK